MEKKYIKIFIYGFSGSGKTTTARIVSKMLGFSFYDTDKIIEKRYKISVYKFIKKYGIKKFRDVEKKLLERLLNLKRNAVVSCGGGMFPIGLKFEKSGIIEIFLNTPYKIISKRFIKISSTRPIIKNMILQPSKIKRLYLSRITFYKRAAFKVRETNSFNSAKKIVKIYYENIQNKKRIKNGDTNNTKNKRSS